MNVFPAHTPRSLRIPGGFTLVELLAVIAITGILAGILIPVTIRIRETARNVECTGNLRALVTGMTLYADANKGVYPAPTNNLLPNGDRGTWMRALKEGGYLDDNPKELIVAGRKSVFLCPAAFKTYPDGLARRTYGMNTLANTDDALRPYELPEPARSLIFADGVEAGGGEGDSWFYIRSGALERIDARHNGAFNAGFVDGHAERLGKTDPRLVEYLDNIRPGS
ncbi:MAG: prepilin-type N-terminal cleavage/methylation domain-containing protein [Opitutaceae bacterium]|jgi:prepilin-type N-terminal cleavage/methylation domain-containing protein/prepilin-type processing-associated H-X9-DG protein|nr:prepilin-type N-terminal cleavage/methylation domain-containing protein [Opitutaceae bacterium]